MTRVTAERELWLARHILPHEAALREQLVRWRLPDDLEADDVVQECYSRLAAMESVAEIQNPRSYFFSIARTTILMHLRRSRVVPIRTVDDLDSFNVILDEPSPEEQASDREQLHLLALAVAKLPDPGRKAFLLRAIDELSHREIGERLGMTGNAVQKSLSKTIQMLGNLLGRGVNADPRASNQLTQSRDFYSNDQSRDERRD
jgi:RNA polymerase sigma-70 factor (ECF subfamily)